MTTPTRVGGTTDNNHRKLRLEADGLQIQERTDERVDRHEKDRSPPRERLEIPRPARVPIAPVHLIMEFVGTDFLGCIVVGKHAAERWNEGRVIGHEAAMQKCRRLEAGGSEFTSVSSASID